VKIWQISRELSSYLGQTSKVKVLIKSHRSPVEALPSQNPGSGYRSNEIRPYSASYGFGHAAEIVVGFPVEYGVEPRG